MSGHYLGAHTIDTGGIAQAARRAGAAKMTALQIFTAIPKFYGDRAGIKPDRVKAFHAALAHSGIEPAHVVAHGAYVLNTASHEEERWLRASAGLAKELERSTALGLGAVCWHPGAAKDGDRDAALGRVARAITGALRAVPPGTRLLVENTAGAGMTIGRTPDEIAGILAAVPAALRARTGYGLDTCHLFAAGHDIASSQFSLTQVLDEFTETIGEPPAFFHVNDSVGALGSNLDRHALIGEGQIGVEPFRWLLADARSQGVPLILETPQSNPDIGEDDLSPDPLDVRMMELLRSLE